MCCLPFKMEIPIPSYDIFTCYKKKLKVQKNFRPLFYPCIIFLYNELKLHQKLSILLLCLYLIPEHNNITHHLLYLPASDLNLVDLLVNELVVVQDDAIRGLGSLLNKSTWIGSFISSTAQLYSKVCSSHSILNMYPLNHQNLDL